MCKFIHHHVPTTVVDPVTHVKRHRHGFTAAYELVDKQIVIGMAVCGGNDMFSRKKGRLISEGRMKTDKAQIVPMDDSFFESGEAGELEAFVEDAVRNFCTDLYFKNTPD